MGSLKIRFKVGVGGGGAHEKLIYRGNSLKRGQEGLRGSLAKKGRVGVVDTPMHTMNLAITLTLILIC